MNEKVTIEVFRRKLPVELDGLGELEDQMCNMTSAGYMGERSPDRVDSLVWGLTDLSQGREIRIIGVF